MTTTKHTDVIRGLSPLNHTQPILHTDVNRQAGGGTPLEDAVNALFGVSDVGDYYKPYDYTTLKSDSGGTGDITGDAQEVGYMAGQRTTGSNVNIVQALSSQKVWTTTHNSMTGIYGPAGRDSLEQTIATLNTPVTFGFQVTTFDPRS